jgi:folate-binding protein YgfZ
MHPTLEVTGGVTQLTDWGLLRVSGADALTFLNSQLTQQVADFPPGQARLAGYCSAKGRLLASFVSWRAADDAVLLACSADLMAITAKRLSMYVLRAKCRVEDISSQFTVMGLAGTRCRAVLGDRLPARPWQVHADADGWCVMLPGAEGIDRFLMIASKSSAKPDLPALAADVWTWLEVRSAVPRIVAATVERFVPPMINFELVGGVDFQKGCYPGQEVVARSQYRGTLKRRMFLFDSDSLAAAPGQEIFHSDDPDQPAGMVVNAAALPGRPSAVLAEVKLSALESGTLHLGLPDGAALRRAALPYPMPEPATT